MSGSFNYHDLEKYHKLALSVEYDEIMTPIYFYSYLNNIILYYPNNEKALEVYEQTIKDNQTVYNKLSSIDRAMLQQAITIRKSIGKPLIAD